MDSASYMKTLVDQFPQQIRQMVSQLKKQTPEISQTLRQPIHQILFLGQGGSGIAGSIWADLLKNSLQIPVYSNKTYDIPLWVGANTLVITCSYSGNTEETLTAFKQAQIKGSQIGVITSGGDLLKEAQNATLPLVLLPDGMPPRACFGYAFTAIAGLLITFGLVSSDILQKLDSAAKNVLKQQSNIQQEGKEIARKIHKTIPIIYTGSENEGLGIRWRQQINENGKQLCWHHTFPELNHNELIGWSSTYSEVSVLVIKSQYDHPRVSLRMEILEEIFERYTEEVITIESAANGPFEELLQLIWLGDYLSLSIAAYKQVDPLEIDNINLLKTKMANL